MLISRADFASSTGLAKDVLSRGGRTGRLPRGTLVHLSTGIASFCYSREEAAAICDKKVVPMPPDHLFRVHGTPVAPGHNQKPMLRAELTSGEWGSADNRQWHAQVAAALSLIAEGHKRLSGLGAPFGYSHLTAPPPEEAPQPVALKPVEEALPKPTLERAPLRIVPPPPRDVFAHLDEEMRILAPANLKRGFRFIANHDWRYAYGLIRPWDGVPMTNAEYSLYASDPTNWDDPRVDD